MKKSVTLTTLLLIIVSLLIGGIQVYAGENWQHNGITMDKPSPQLVDNDIVLTANVKGPKEGLQYKFVWQRENWEEGNWGVIRAFEPSNITVWKPTKPGNYTIYSDIQDKYGNKITREINYNIWQHNGITTDRPSPQLVDNDIVLTANVKGPKEGLQYKFVWQRENWEEGNWGVIRAFEPSNITVWKPTRPGNYTIYSDIQDKYGNKITREINYNIWQHNGITTDRPSPQLVDNDIVLTANVKGPKEGLQYKFVWQRENWEEGNWGVIRAFEPSNITVWKPTRPGNYTIYSDIKSKYDKPTTRITSFNILVSPQEINYSSGSVPAGKTLYLGVEGTTRLSTSNENIAKITPHNMVYGVSPGTAIIKAYNTSGKVLLERKVTVGQAQPIKFAYACSNESTHGSTFDLIAITDKSRDAVGFIAGGKFIEAKEKVEEGNTYVWIAKNVAVGLGNTEVKACSRNKGVWSTCSDGKISLYLNNKDDNIPSLKRRNISEAGIKFIAECEGFASSVYGDKLASNKPTIGYGKLIRSGDTFYNNLTKREAQAMLIYSLNNGSYISSVNNFLIKNSVKFNQNHFDSLVSFSYNLGTSWMDDDKEVRGYIFNTFEKGTTQRNLSCIDPKGGFSYEMLSYHRAGEKRILGLLYRRIDEMNIFFKGDYTRHAYKCNKYGYRIPERIKGQWDAEK